MAASLAAMCSILLLRNGVLAVTQLVAGLREGRLQLMMREQAKHLELVEQVTKFLSPSSHVD